MPFPSSDSRMFHQRRAEILDVRATPNSKNTLATKFPLIMDGEYHSFVTSKPRDPCQLYMFNSIEIIDRMTRT